jgi:glycine cleavage system H protein
MTTYYTKDHEWISVDGASATIGITKYAAGQLGDVVYVELPDQGRMLARGDGFAVVESVKAASDVYAPVSGEVTTGNSALAGTPETVNADPEGEGWFVTMTIANAAELSGLMDAAAYKAFCDTL